jgi:SHS2 domain-containing protein
MKYKFLEHTADLKFQAYGKNLDEVFKSSAYALKKVICEDRVKEKIKKNIKINGTDLENLLYKFLEEILILFDSENFILGKIAEIKIDENKFKLKTKILGDNAKNYKINSGLKAITYNEMFVKKIKDKWISQVVLDI